MHSSSRVQQHALLLRAAAILLPCLAGAVGAQTEQGPAPGRLLVFFSDGPWCDACERLDTRFGVEDGEAEAGADASAPGSEPKPDGDDRGLTDPGRSDAGRSDAGLSGLGLIERLDRLLGGRFEAELVRLPLLAGVEGLAPADEAARDEAVATARRYAVTRVPTLIFTDPVGRPLRRLDHRELVRAAAFERIAKEVEQQMRDRMRVLAAALAVRGDARLRRLDGLLREMPQQVVLEWFDPEVELMLGVETNVEESRARQRAWRLARARHRQRAAWCQLEIAVLDARKAGERPERLRARVTRFLAEHAPTGRDRQAPLLLRARLALLDSDVGAARADLERLMASDADSPLARVARQMLEHLAR